MPEAGRLGDQSFTPACAHGCPKCPHPAIGPAIVGSPNVQINGLPALRVGDMGVHAACCGPNTWVAMAGSGKVLINYMPAFRKNDQSQHCGGMGYLVTASMNVIIGG